MGKPFAKELEKISETLKWAFEQDTKEIREEILYNSKKALFIVGSGGSLSACYYAALLYQQYGMMAKAVTPLDLVYSKNALRQSNILFISASGKNTDILFGFRTSLTYEPNRIYSLCMKKHSPLGKLASENSICKSFEFAMPAGKDGFLATNSLIAFFGVLYNALNDSKIISIENLKPSTSYFENLENFINKVAPDFTFTVLYAGWGHPVAVDIESKLAEAALADILLSDYRNFGHGRHHWFDKRKENSAIIALITPEEEKIAEKTLSFLPDGIPVLKITADQESALASISLLIKSFYFIEKMGKMQKIDPGKPGVPDFGRKLYNLNYKNFYKTPSGPLSETERVAITRKANVPSFEHLKENEKKYWYDAYKKFVERFNKTEFGTIVFDYDGTLCSAKNRYLGAEKEVIEYLINILEHGFIIGIATGRGKSVRLDLKKSIPKAFHNQIVVGYYNCNDIGLLSDDKLPNKSLPENLSLREIYDMLISYPLPEEVLIKIRPKQLTIEIQNKKNWVKVRPIIIQLIMIKNIHHIGILESSHSMDIIDHSVTSKLNITKFCLDLAKEANFSNNIMTIGDKGQWPGNDYQLLSTPFSLSVDEVSPLYDTCWNLATPGIKNVDATIYYLKNLTLAKNSFKINL